LTWKLIVAYLGWLLAASALGLLFGLLLGEAAAAVRVVESGSDGQQTVVEVSSISCFVLLALLPFLLRGRIIRSEGSATEGPE
jgi:hypothetical protein